MEKIIKTFATFIFIIMFDAMAPVMAADKNLDWEAQVRKTDEAFWNDFNFSPSATLNSYYTGDVEFYHDLGGTIMGLEALANVNAGMDKGKNRGRRVLVAGSLRIYPMRKDKEIYGALVMGEHDFYSTDSGKIVKRTLRASFTHIMLLKNGVWKIARIISYDHKMDPDNTK
ncbi:DUF4440 domain-containing protein [Pseudoduganella danionis]|uniref:DUF4440 domain-containing protein n=1 Tax=Pseudoduganella danionis TaxID=1890295 RepID=A0ABW9SP53_9BURK|nr:DUF4440 domain-containing protein [Pseudoduganella danionis]MTW32499.1 DUF4440 domain-containing protein [Pseudoduganella danionis]